MHSRARHTYTLFLAAATAFLLFAGGMVTSTDSGLAVPDWPLSFGSLNPPMVGGVFYEHGHRMIASAVGLMILILTVWTLAREPRVWVRRLSLFAFAAVVMQGLLGGLTVLLKLPPQVSMLHTLMGNTVFCCVLALALATGPRWQEAPVRLPDPGRPGIHFLARLVAGIAAVQLALGALVRHAHVGVSVHMTVALLLTMGLVALWARVLRFRGLPPEYLRLASVLVGSVILQAGLGLFSWMLHNPPFLATLHMIVGSLIVAALVLLAWMLRRGTEPAGCQARAAA